MICMACRLCEKAERGSRHISGYEPKYYRTKWWNMIPSGWDILVDSKLQDSEATLAAGILRRRPPLPSSYLKGIYYPYIFLSPDAFRPRRGYLKPLGYIDFSFLSVAVLQ
ncbi:hypothetical protein CPSG_03303 [Coccidioides posadasii str. Silveira]|uniref:Uncharacterized protein n=1 Tax=Coccidioides posadasii (strain RMSCC 757 / Silveira) TaxID=443226 RepID=E9CZM5_COCPS|nr:hypothetical protein CPSG_03303 [Coccidioides posadasii str. Silveira]